MDAKEYCSAMQIELTGWKAKIYDTIRKIDRMSSGDKEMVMPYVNDLHMTMDELTEKIEWLSAECPLEYETHKNTVDERVGRLGTLLEDILENANPV